MILTIFPFKKSSILDPDPDPDHLVGFWSTSGNIDLDPGSEKKNCDKIKQNYQFLIYFLISLIYFKKSLILSIYVNNKLINYKTKHSYELYTFIKKIGVVGKEKKFNFCL